MKVVIHEKRREDDAEAAKVFRRLREDGSTDLRDLWAIVDSRRYSVLVTRDPLASRLYRWKRKDGDFRWHISVAGESDVPKWRYLVAIAHELRPGVCFVVGVPPRSWWMNVHPHCLHLWETTDANLMAQWKSEAQGHAPS